MLNHPMNRRIVPLLVVACSASCGDEFTQGIEQSMRVEGAVFRSERMPGVAPQSEGSSEGSSEVVAGPVVTAVEVTNSIIVPWQQGRRLAGRASADAFSVGIQLADDVETGYWVVPVQAPDPLANNEYTFEVTWSAGDLAPGLTDVRLVALDEQGRGGLQRNVPVCVVPEYPDNLNACDSTLRPPDTVVTLTWNSEADLDLFLIAPDGRVLDARQPLWIAAGTPATSADARNPVVPRHLGDSQANCDGDVRRRETVVFDQSPGDGTWLVYARASGLCGASSAAARLEVLRNLQLSDGTWQLLSTGIVSTTFGLEQLAQDRADGTYLVAVSFP
jgi:hypothetical protein